MDHSEKPLGQSPVNEWVEEKLATLRSPSGWQPNVEMGRAILERRLHFRSAGKQPLLIAVSAALAVGGLLAYPQSRVIAQRCVHACVAGTNAFGQLLGIKARVAGWSAERRPAPTFSLPDVDGNPVDLSELRGKVVVVNFWATWCEPCKVEIPWFMEFNTSFRNQGFAVVGVSMDEDGWKSVRPYLHQRGVNYQVVLGDERLANAYGGVEALPSTFIIDRAGRIAAAHAGLVARATYEEEIQRLLTAKEISE